MNWRSGAIFGLVSFLLVCGWWLAHAVVIYARIGHLEAVAAHTEMADPGTVLSRALAAMIVAFPVGAYLGGRARVLVEEAKEENEGFALMAADEVEGPGEIQSEEEETLES